MTAVTFSPDQTDALQEVANIAMGQAGDALGRMLDTLISLSVPRARIVAAAEMADCLRAMVTTPDQVTAVRQSFFDRLRGEALVLYGPTGCRGLADLLGHEQEPDERLERELLLDVSNILVGAVLNAIGGQLATEFGFAAPEILAVHGDTDGILEPARLRWRRALLVEVNFSVEARGFRCHLILLMPEEAIEAMCAALDRMLAEL